MRAMRVEGGNIQGKREVVKYLSYLHKLAVFVTNETKPVKLGGKNAVRKTEKIMRKVSDAVRNQLMNSESALTSLTEGVLNLSAYAKKIQKEIEKETMKPVKIGTIVAALARMSQDIDALPVICPPVKLLDIAVKSGLCEFAFEQSEANRMSLQKLYESKSIAASDFFTATHGIGELALVASDKYRTHILKLFQPQEPKLVSEKLCALTVRFAEHYIDTPGQTFWLVRKIAIERLNIVEIISTFTELTFLLHEKDINKAFAVFTPHLGI